MWVFVGSRHRYGLLTTVTSQAYPGVVDEGPKESVSLGRFKTERSRVSCGENTRCPTMVSG